MNKKVKKLQKHKVIYQITIINSKLMIILNLNPVITKWDQFLQKINVKTNRKNSLMHMTIINRIIINKPQKNNQK